MDAFYASVELLRYPELRGQAVVIGGGRRHQPEMLGDGTRRFATLRHYTGRGVITTATYAARDFGVHSGMGLMKAALRAPDAVLLPVDFDEYRRYSRLFKAAVAEVAPVIEDRGIDEIYIDLSEVPGIEESVGHDALGGVRALAQEIRNNVRRTTGLTCSIGVTPNKLLSKIASELDKPDGLTILTEADIPRACGRWRCARSTASAPRPPRSSTHWASRPWGRSPNAGAVITCIEDLRRARADSACRACSTTMPTAAAGPKAPTAPTRATSRRSSCASAWP
jgi:hypothetical protein